MQDSTKINITAIVLVCALVVVLGFAAVNPSKVVEGFRKLSFLPSASFYFLADTSAPSVTVGNATAAASSASLNAGGAITLTENTTTTIAATGTVTDNNSCQDLVSVDVAVYKDLTTCTAAGNADNDVCYFWTDSSPSTDASCTGADDTTYAVSRNFSIQYYADGGSWKATITPNDEGAGTANTSSTVTLNNLQSLDVGASISFGSVSVGSNSTGDIIATVTNTGNIAIDFNLSGGALTCTARGSVPVGNQEYSLSSFTYNSGTDLSTTPTAIEAILGIPESDTVPISDNTYWQVGVPNGVEGTCSGTTTFTATAD